MGKYIRKPKTSSGGEMSVMEVTQSSLGVRTRAKTLASQKSSSPSPQNSACYLQLRSRRLLKPPILVHTQYSSRRSHKQTQHQNPNPSPSNPNPRASSRLRMGSVESIGSFVNSNNNCSNSSEDGQKKGLVEESDVKCHTNPAAAAATAATATATAEGSFGDNVLEFEGRDRSTRESTPCSLIRDPDAVRTPGSTTRPTSLNENDRRIQNADQRPIPTAHEMNEFFAGAEEEQRRAFVEKYNFDPVNEKPLPGRYEWEKLDP